MSKIKKVSKGILDGLNDTEPPKSKRVKEEKSNDVDKAKRSYMLPKKTIKKLELIKVKETGVTLSELVQEAIELLYKERTKE